MKLILLTITIICIFLSLLSAQEVEDYAVVSIYEDRGVTLVYESNRSKTIFKDINVSFSLLKSNDETITIDNIKNHSKAFKPVPKTETFQDDNVTYWLKVDLGTAFPSGRFVYSYADADFTDNTILPSQQLEKFVLDGVQDMKFTYKQGVDPQIYYFKLVPKHYRIPFRFVYVSTPATFYSYLSKSSHVQLILGLILGLIIMAGIYNAAMYYYNRDKAFLYYALLQLFMALLLYDYSGANFWNETSFFCRNLSYDSIVSLLASLFATLFTISFLETKKYLPKIDTILRWSIVILLSDMFISLFYRSLLVEYYLLPFLMLPFLYAGYKRMRQGYKPARFYLAGWTALTLSVFLSVFQIDYEVLLIDPLYIGAATEAILFSLALSYKIRLVHKEKEEQKELLVHQSKLASMGEMIGNIAHQWRQPLTHLGYTLMNIGEAQKHGELTDATLEKKIDEANTQLNFMSQTIDDFKDFYAPNKEKENFSLAAATRETLDIISNTLKLSDIKTELVTIDDTQVYNYKNEYKQVLLNLLSNAKDVLVERATKAPKIRIRIDSHTVSVEDNAGGIMPNVLPHIFEPYYSTKEGNSGIGLYMSKMIVEKNMKGELKVDTSDDKTIFCISF
ncbi:MAG: histidine kinase [Sulfurovum sp.]|nr:MAG: histidine kinase [Sulfurovum sp.]